MNVLINKDDKILLNHDKSFFADASYHIDMNICPNLTCNCGDVEIFIKKGDTFESADIEYSFGANVLNKSIAKIREQNNLSDARKIETIDFYSTNLTGEDWNILRDVYYWEKFLLIEEAEISKVEFDFSREHYEDDTLMFTYNDIFPGSVFLVSYQNKKYIFFDHYCKSVKCDCNDMYFEIYEVDLDRKGEDLFIGKYFYNYETQKNKSEGQKILIEDLIQKLKDRYVEIDVLLTLRNLKVRTIYGNAKIKFLKQDIFWERQLFKVGRNEPCPCGSRKKYKRCCMKKEMV